MGAVAQRPEAGEVIGVEMRIDSLHQLEVELADELDVTVDLLQHRIDDQRLAAAPTGDEPGVEIGAACDKCPPQLFRRYEPSVLDDGRGGDIEGARYVTGAHPRARFRRLSEKALRGARIHHLSRAARQGCAHRGE